MRHPSRVIVWFVAAVAAAGAGADVVFAVSEAGPTISQKNRQFSPGDVTLPPGKPLVVVNDDEDLLHHLYVDAENFSFDSGDQEPGSRTTIVFPARGEYKVLCGIHPKMKLAVHVR